MKTQGMPHQLEYLRRAEGREYFGLFMEQGTGKTWSILADAERLYAAGKIDALFVLAPNGVHTNWPLREIPTHMEADVIARTWRAGAGVIETRRREDLFVPRKHGATLPLRVLAMNIDGIRSDAAFKFAMRFLNATRPMIAVDESTRIKNPRTTQSERAIHLRQMADYARIASGRPNPQSPLDFFGQMEFLRSGLLGTSSYRAFVAEYADLVDMEGESMKNMVRRNKRAKFAQIIAKDPDTNAPMYKNLDRLQRLIEPHAYRVLKRDCLSLPPKVYQRHFFDLTPAQRRAYNLMQEEQRIVLDGEETPVRRLGAMTKLQQIVSGFVIINGEVLRPPQLRENPRLDALLELVEDDDEPMIVWARFREELSVISEALRKAGRRVVEYHGGISTRDRDAAVDAFQSGEADSFVGQPQAGGIGITLTRARWSVYYSNDFNLETRIQSEDRNHRIGTVGDSVRYVDLIAVNTIDEAIVASLQRKERMSSAMLGDARLERAVRGAAPDV
jgi:SNF2 family DNA or RNA helicase